MEHFEEWYKEYTARVDSGLDYLDAQVGYKEALGWILGQHCCGDWDDGSALETEIKNELGET